MNLTDKRTSLKKAISRYLKDNISIGLGGFVDTRIPVAATHEIIRQGAHNITLMEQSGSICTELLAGAMILNSDHLSIKRIKLGRCESEAGEELPLLRYLSDRNMIQLDNILSGNMVTGFRAAAMGVSFLPVRTLESNNPGQISSEIIIECPFIRQKVCLVPACHPDLSIVHVQASDRYGNSRIFGNLCNCPQIAEAGTRTIVTTEQIIPESSFHNYPNLTEIPCSAVDAVVDQPFGSTPGKCYGHYRPDRDYLHKFREIRKEFCRSNNRERLREFYNKYIFGVETFDDYLEEKPYPVLQNLCQLDEKQPLLLD
ncbi:CoA transferase subunit A [Desulfomarina sp.]